MPVNTEAAKAALRLLAERLGLPKAERDAAVAGLHEFWYEGAAIPRIGQEVHPGLSGFQNPNPQQLFRGMRILDDSAATEYTAQHASPHFGIAAKYGGYGWDDAGEMGKTRLIARYTDPAGAERKFFEGGALENSIRNGTDFTPVRGYGAPRTWEQALAEVPETAGKYETSPQSALRRLTYETDVRGMTPSAVYMLHDPASGRSSMYEVDDLLREFLTHNNPWK